MAQLTPIKGLIELQDDFTSQLGVAKSVLQDLSKVYQESMKAIAGATGLVVAGLAAVAVATVALGRRGSEVQNIENAFRSLTTEADAMLASVRLASKGMVSDFDIMAAANKALLLGLPVTAEEMGTLTETAITLGRAMKLDTTTALNDLVTALGRSSPLILDNLGLTVKVGEANETYAKKLGKTVSQLSDAEKKTAFYEAAMTAAASKVESMGEIQLTFADRLAQGQVMLSNWIDELGKAVNASPAFTAGLETIIGAIEAAFGANSQDSIETVVGFLEGTAIVIVNVGLATVEMARVVNVAWSLVKTVLLGTLTAIVAVETAVVTGLVAIADAAEALKIIPEGAAQALKDTNEQLKAMTVSLAKQTAEAAKGIVGHSEFDKTLDRIGGTLFQVKDAMQGATAATEEMNAATQIAEGNTRQLAQIQRDLTKAVSDRIAEEEQLVEAEKKIVEGISETWQEYFQLRTLGTKGTLAAQKLAIDQWFADEVESLDASDRNWQDHYDALSALAGEKLRGITIDWEHLNKVSITSLKDTATVARNTYNEMSRQAHRFTREALQEQLAKVRETAAAARSMGQDFVAAHAEATEAAAKQAEELDKVRLAAEAAAAAANRSAGGSFEITAANLQEQALAFGINADAALAWAKLGYSFQHILEFVKRFGFPPPNTAPGPGPRIPGFQAGGTVIVGEGGPEIVRLPLGSTVLPTGVQPPPTGNSISLVFNVNGTGRDVAQQIKRTIMRELKVIRQFGAV